ncbi:ATP-binding cassette sub- B member 6, mitochondrial [Dinochytrium kinnereticum]|nr:ATP-binding cassette sub- B member 6, mitochondrial [Dinochytrium kinnereticum]
MSSTSPAFCPAPYLEGSLIAPCLLDNVESAVLLVTAALCLGLAVQHRRRSGSAAAASSESRGDRQSLLGRDGEPNANEDDDDDGQASSLQRRAAPALTASYTMCLLVILCLVTMLAVDIYLYLTPSTPKLPQLVRISARISADSIATIAWVIATAASVVTPRATVTIGVRFWSIALVFEVLQGYQWLVVLMREDASVGSASGGAVEFIWAAASAVKLILVASLIAISWMTRRDVSDVHDVENVQVEEAVGDSENEKKKKKNSEGSSWALTIKNFRKLVPFLWPRGLYLQSLVGLSFGMLILGRVVNVAVPFQYKIVVDVLTDAEKGNKGPYYVWAAVLTFCFFRYLQGGVGLVSTLQSLFWIPVGQYNAREISVSMLRHLHDLSLQFHINRKTGEVLRVMDRGTSSVSSLLSAIVFNILPIFVDIGVAVVLLMLQFDVTAGMIVLLTMALYIGLTVAITEWRTKFRREMNELDNLARARAVDSLLNFETVKYYNNEDYEVSRFEASIQNYQKADWKSNASLSILNTAQNTVITIGLIAGSTLIAKRVLDHTLTIGDFILFITYIIQLYQPLNWFGTYYRVIQQNFIDMESMFELFAEQADIQDLPNSKQLEVRSGGTVKFENVSFAYDSRLSAINNMSFEVPAKTTTALVGATGSGKSTVFRLLFRFYNPTSGRILVDGQDIATVSQKSLRKAIGVVPQDTVLFNDSIAYNIAYGDTTMGEDAVIEAAKMAQIHDKIMTFPDGYETRVGERGLRLSGGEKQRVAIARTMLKNPDIILLDEATSALDNTTESLIQRSLKELTSRKTTIVIAHRLSTIVDADCILVLKDGRIVERGTHHELLKRGEERAKVKASKTDADAIEEDGVGTYFNMWMRQLEETSSGEVQDGKEEEKALMSVRRARGLGGDVKGGAGHHGGGHGGGRFH